MLLVRKADEADSGKGAKEVTSIAQTAASEALAGLVERVTFHNPENGFCVLRVKARGHRDLVTVVGRAALISAGEFIQMSGAWVNDRIHGQQFRASFLKTSPPTTLEGIERYLASGMIRGIGPIYAKRLVQGFGELDELVLAYATTIHKSQGSEYPAVVIPLGTQHYMMLARNLLYTGVTRGKRLVVLVGQRKALAIAVRNQGTRRRWAKLREHLAATRGGYPMSSQEAPRGPL
jgi:ATP-dependent exoDNAse (exonuclease V) alpha subunit